MPYLPTLLKRIEQFAKLAQQGHYMPDDPEEEEEDDGGNNNTPGMYAEIIETARTIKDPDVRTEVLLIAELYKKAVDMNDGFNYVNKALSGVINILDDDSEEEQERVEGLLNSVSKDLRDRAKVAGNVARGDGDQAISALRKTKDAFNQEAIQEDLSGQNNSYGDDDLTGFEQVNNPNDSISENEGPGKGQPEGASVFDLSGGVRGEVGDKVNRGYSTGIKTYTDWVKRFADERDRFLNNLQDPDLNTIKTKVPSEREKERKHKETVKKNLTALVGILNQSVGLMDQAIKLQDQVSAAPEDEEAKKSLEEVRQQLMTLQREKYKYKLALRQDILKEKADKIQEQLVKSTNPQEKKWLEEKLNLEKAKMSKDRNKSEEIKWRKNLVNSLAQNVNGQMVFTNISPETEKSIREKIDAGRAERISAEKIEREMAERRAKLKGVADPTAIKTKKERRFGIDTVAKYDFKVLELEQLVEHLSQRLATGRVVAKQAVTHELTEGKKTHNALKPYVDAVAEAATKRDRPAFANAVKILNEKAKEFASKSVATKTFLWNVRYSKVLYDIKDRYKMISEWLNKGLVAPPQDVIATTISDTLKLSKGLIRHYENNYPVKKDRIRSLTAERGFGAIYFDKAIEVLKEIVAQLETKKVVNE